MALAAVMVVLALPLRASAADDDATTDTNASEPINRATAIHSYQSDAPLQRGMLVRLDANDAKKVLPVTDTDMIDVFGTVVDPSDSAISLGANEAAGNITYVATSGIYNVLVSDQTGQIHTGDYLTVSSLAGIGMKATDKQSTVVGVARTNFDGKTNVTGQTTLIGDDGNPLQTVNLGMIPVAISIQHNPLITNTRADLPQWLIKTGLVDKDVKPIRIYISMGILGLAIIVAITILYAGIRHSVISIGRNPLSRGSVAKSLLSIFLSAFIILSIGGFTVYLLLKL